MVCSEKSLFAKVEKAEGKLLGEKPLELMCVDLGSNFSDGNSLTGNGGAKDG